jgi:hypothetical protein
VEEAEKQSCILIGRSVWEIGMTVFLVPLPICRDTIGVRIEVLEIGLEAIAENGSMPKGS